MGQENLDKERWTHILYRSEGMSRWYLDIEKGLIEIMGKRALDDPRLGLSSTNRIERILEEWSQVDHKKAR